VKWLRKSTNSCLLWTP